MPIFHFTAPDGKKYKVTAPEGTAPEGAFIMLKKQLGQQVPQFELDAAQGPEVPGAFGSSMISAGRSFDKLAKGLEQGFYNLTGNKTEQARLAEQEKANDLAFSRVQEKHPVASVLGGALPYFMAPTGGLAQTAATGAGIGALNYTPEGESTAMNALIGGAASGAGYGVGKLLTQPFAKPTTELSGEATKVLKAAQKLGAKTTPGQIKGSKVLQQVEASMESFPPTAGPMAKVKAVNQKLLNKTAAAAIGERSDEVGSSTFAAAHERIGQTFEKLTKGKKFVLGQQQLDDLASIEQEFNNITGQSLTSHPLAKRTLELIAGGDVKGEAYQELVSNLSKAARANLTSQSGNRELGMALGEVKGMLDDAVGPQMGKIDQASFQKARAEWRALITLMKPGAVNESTGNVSGATLANVLKRTDRRGFTLGKNTDDLYTMARFAQAFKPIVGDSGTATRQFVPWLGAGAGAGFAGGAAMGMPALGTAAGLAAPFVANVGARAYLGLGPLAQRGFMSPTMQQFLAGVPARATLGAGLDYPYSQ